MQTVNAESKGLGKTVFGSLDRQDKIDNIDEVTLNYGKKSATGLLGAEKILYEVNDKGEIVEEKGVRKSNSMNGFVAEFGTSELNKIGRALLPYDNNIIKGLFKYFGEILQRRGESISKNEEFMSETFSAIKSFIFSNKKLFGEDFDIKTERKRLFVGSYKEVGDGRLEVDIPSLPDIVDGIKATPLGESNALLRSLIPDLSMRTSRVKLIKYTASAGQNLDESELHQAFIALFRENVDIPYSLNGVEMTKNSRELAMDLIKYVYLSGGTQEAIQFTRYIPIDVLNYMGFSDVLKGVAGKFTASTFGIEMKENNIVSSNVTEQILQHNPKKVPVKVKGMLAPNSKENFKSGIKNVKSTKRVDGVEIITEFELVLDAKNPKLSTGEYMVNQPYISGKFDKSRDWVIYKFNGKSYQLIPTLGTFGVSEYDFNLAPGQVAESIIPGRNLKHVDNSVPTELKDKGSEVIDDSKFDIEKTYNLFAHVNDDNQIESVLNLIKDSNNLDPYHKELAENLLQNTHLLATLSKIKIHYSSDLNDAGLFSPYESSDESTRGRIDISNNPKIHRDKSSLDRAILHEINHAYTLRVLRDYEFGRRDLPQNVINAIQKIDILRRSLKYKFKQNDALKKSFERVEEFLNPKTHSTTKLSPEDMITYGLISNVEFVTMAMENPLFRDAIDGLSKEFPNETPFLTRLWNALLELIGLQNTSQITKDYVTREIFQFIKEINISLDKSIEKPQVIEGFSNSQKYKDVEKALEDLEKGSIIETINQYTDVEIKDETPIDSKYELFPGVYANNGQRDAIDRLEEFLNSKEDEFTLVGRGGTGKTTIIKKIIAEARGNVGGITVAHKAKKVLGASIGKHRVKTIASALAIKLDETTGKFEPDMFARKNGRVPIANMDIIIVDEASMISKAMYDEIMTLKKRSAKVIFMGDNAQLPPIGASEESPVFKSKNKYILTEKMRQAKTSPIIGIGTLVANNVESTSPKLKVIPKELRADSFDQQSGSSVKFTDNESKALDEFVEDFKNANGNPDFVKIVTFNNQNHSSSQSVKSLNEKVRTKLFGKRASEQFIVGEMVTAYDTYSRDAGQDVDEIPIHNSDDFIINDIELAKGVKGSVSAQSVKDGYRKFDYQYDIIHLSLLDNEGKPILGETVPVIANSSKAKFEADLKELWSRDKQLAFKLKGEFANLEYGYAITSHKAQGSTYTNVYVMEDNILGPTNGSDVKAKNQSLYVAVSRPTTKLVMISSGQQQQSVGGEFDFIDPGVDIDKDNFADGTVEWTLSPSIQEDIDLSLTREEIKMLEAKHGKNALSDYNQLTDKEKEYIIKCLR